MKRNNDKIKPEKPDRRKIPQLFRAGEKGDDDWVCWGYLIDDDHFKFISFSAHFGNDSSFKERLLIKKNFNFSKIDAHDFEMHIRPVLHRLAKEASDLKLEFEKAEHYLNYATRRLEDILEEMA